MRGTTLMEFDPDTKTRKVVRSPVVAVQRVPGGVIIFVSPDRKVCGKIIDPFFKPFLDSTNIKSLRRYATLRTDTDKMSGINMYELKGNL